MHEKKAFSVVPKASPRRPNHVTICLLRLSGESLQKWPTRAPKTKLILCPRDPQGYSCIRSEPARQDFERVPVFHGFCEIALTEVLATQMGVMRRSKKSDCLKCINLIHFRLTAGRLRGSSCIVIPGVVCELLQFAATQ